MQKLTPQFRKETWKERFRSIWIRLSIPISIIEITAPAGIGAIYGHIWGAATAAVNIIVWLYFGLKSRMAPWRMMLWLLALVYVVIVAVVEFAHLFHWHF